MRKVYRYILAYITMLFIFTSSMIIVNMIPPNYIKKNALQSIEIFEKDSLLSHNLYHFSYLDLFTDALMINESCSADSRHPVESAMLNRLYWHKDSWWKMCENTKEMITDGPANMDEHVYGRYWHGYQIFQKPLLVFFDISIIRYLNMAILSLLAVITIILLWKRICWQVGLFFFATLVLAEPVAIGMCMQYSACFYLMLLGMLILLCFPSIAKEKTRVALFFFVLGGLLSFFDLLVTPLLTLGFPMITAILLSRGNEYRKMLKMCGAWLFGYALLWCSKWGMGFLLSDTNLLASAYDAFTCRVGSFVEANPIQIPHLRRICFFVVLIMWAVSAWLGRYKGKSPNLLLCKKNNWLIVISLMVPTWFVVLYNHSILHLWFTWRTWVLFVFSLSLFTYLTFFHHEKDCSSHTMLQ